MQPAPAHAPGRAGHPAQKKAVRWSASGTPQFSKQALRTPHQHEHHDPEEQGPAPHGRDVEAGRGTALASAEVSASTAPLMEPMPPMMTTLKAINTKSRPMVGTPRDRRQQHPRHAGFSDTEGEGGGVHPLDRHPQRGAHVAVVRGRLHHSAHRGSKHQQPDADDQLRQTPSQTAGSWERTGPLSRSHR